jgi:hypothetical protein
MEVRMADTRLLTAEPPDGIARRLSAAIVRVNGYCDWVAIGRESAVVGETVILDVGESDRPEELAMCVIESRPFVLDGDTRHWIRLLATDLPFEQQVRRG